MSKINRIKEQIKFCIRSELWEKLHPLLAELHPADIADVIEDAPDEIHSRIFDLLGDETKADVLSELDGSTEADLLDELTAKEISDLAEEMAPDDAADMLAELDEKRSAEVIDLVYFAALPQAQVAEFMKISIKTVERDLKYGRAFINEYIHDLGYVE